MKATFISFLLGLCAHVALADETPKPALAQAPELASELLRRTKTDQDARFAMIEWMKDHGSAVVEGEKEQAEFDSLAADLKQIDDDNTAWLKGVVERQGWPTITLVGAEAASASWLLVQHADADLKFQRQCLDLMARLPKDEASPRNVAYLTDRVLLAEGKKQLYGTQFANTDGQWKPRPLADEANVDKRHHEVGLPPLAEYAKLIEQQYGAGKAK